MKKHGMSNWGLNRHPLYWAWQGMIQRCTNPNHKNWKQYGARGITVCARWKNSFTDFLEDMPGWLPGLTIHRKSDGNYGPGECCWATMKEQNNHSRHNRIVTINEETMSVTKWCERTGVRAGLALLRINRGWPPEEAVTKPKLRSRYSR